MAAAVISHWSHAAHGLHAAPKGAASLRSLVRAGSGIFSKSKKKEEGAKEMEPEATIHVLDRDLHVSLST